MAFFAFQNDLAPSENSFFKLDMANRTFIASSYLFYEIKKMSFPIEGETSFVFQKA